MSNALPRATSTRPCEVGSSAATQSCGSSESPLPLTEKSLSESTHPSPYADWDEASEGENVVDKQFIAKKMLRNNGKGTSPKAMPRKETLHPRSVRNRSRFRLVRKRHPRGLPAGQVLAEMHIPIMALDQVLLEPFEDRPIGEVY